MSQTFTSQQIQDWCNFEKVRKSGKYNMLDTAARHAAFLTREEHMFCIKNYDELKQAAEGKS